METSFNPADFVRRIGKELVREFNDARQATTPGLVGDAMEDSVTDRLKQILPRGVGVGSGCVIDVYGGTSRQMDIVLYEEDQCPVFRVSSPKASYYPCEGVVAVGEVKSRVGKKELADGFSKIRSVKALHRAYNKSVEPGVAVGRTYGSSSSEVAHGFDSSNTNRGDIFGFILAEEPAVRVEKLIGHYASNVEALRNDVLSPDLVVFLQGDILKRENSVDGGQRRQPGRYVPTRSTPVLPHVILPATSDSPFAELVMAVWEHHQEGLTAHLPLRRYLQYTESNAKPQYVWAVFVNSGLDIEKLVADEDAGKNVRVEMPITPTKHLRFDSKLLQRATRNGK